MEDLLDRYDEPDDPKRPRVCVDERPWQLLADRRTPLPLVPGFPARFDDEDTRPGTWHLFIMAEPFQGWRHGTVTTQRTTREFAQGMADVVPVHCPEAEKIRVVLDQLSPQTPGALYEAFPPAEARRILRTLAFHPTPGHGRWLKMAEIELAVLARQCLSRRIPDRHTMAREVAAWEARRNRHHAMIAWRLTTKEARINLKSLDPKESA
jgi:hypothetical protein